MPARVQTLNGRPPGGTELRDLKPPPAAGGLSPNPTPTARVQTQNNAPSRGKKSSPLTWINVRVGQGTEAKDFQVNTKACKFSGHLRRLCASGWTARIDLFEESPKAFELFLQWIQLSPSLSDLGQGKPPEEPWISHAAAAWVLARNIEAVDFEKYALYQFIQSCAFAPIGPWEYLEKKAPSPSPINRFCNYWIAWNHYLAGQGTTEYSGLKAVALVNKITAKTADPRVYDIQHWYSYCSDDFNPTCAHNPSVREANLQKPKPVKKPSAEKEWGRSFEEARQGRVDTTASPNLSISAASNRPASPVSSASPARPASPMNPNPNPVSLPPPNYDSDSSSCCCCCCCCCC